MRRTTVAGLAVLLAIPTLARADDDADRRAAARAVLDELHSAEMVSNLVPNIIGQLKLNITRNDPDLVKQFDSFQPKLQAAADAQKPALMDKLVDVYAKTFTTAELNDMLAMYKSPLGQRIIQTQGQINRDMLAAARDWGNAVAKTMAADAMTELQGTSSKTP